MKKLIITFVIFLSAFIYGEADSTMVQIHGKATIADTDVFLVSGSDTVYWKITYAQLKTLLNAIYLVGADTTFDEVLLALSEKPTTAQMSNVELRVNALESPIVARESNVQSRFDSVWTAIRSLQPLYPLTPFGLVANAISDVSDGLVWQGAYHGYDAAIIWTSSAGVGYTELARQVGSDSTYTRTGLTANTLSYYYVTFYDSTLNLQSGASNIDTSVTHSAASPLNNLYVDKNANGANDGSSWTNAYESFAAINWINVVGIDSLLISGGTDSTIYTEALFVGGGNINTAPTVNVSGTSGHPLVITKGKDAGHNGLVVIDGANTRDFNITIVSLDYIKLIDLKVKRPLRWTHIGVENPIKTGRAVYFNYTNYCELDSCTIEHDYGLGMMLYYSDHAKILHNLFYTNPVDTMAETIGIAVARSCDDIEIAYNTIIQRNIHNGTSLDCHKDLIQIEQSSPYNNNGSVHHNFGMHDITSTVTYTAGFQLVGLTGVWSFYNNVIIVRGGVTSVANRMSATNAGDGLISKFYNNTVISEGSFWQDYAMEFKNNDSVYCYNNIFYRPNDGYGLRYDGTTEANIKADYNRWYTDCSVGTNYFASPGGGVYRTFAYWQSTMGEDAHGSFGTVSFTSLWSTTLANYKTTGAWTGIGLGVSNTIATDDIEGTARPQNTTWDIGAFER